MDPDQTLKEAREALANIRGKAGVPPAVVGAQVEQLIDAFEALDGWLSKGGFLPSEWSASPGYGPVQPGS